MDAIPFIKEILSKPDLRVFLLDSEVDTEDKKLKAILRVLDIDIYDIGDFFRYLKYRLRVDTEHEKLETIKWMQVGFRKFGILRRENFERPLTHRGMTVTGIKKELDSFINGLCGETCNKRELESFIHELFYRSRERRKGSQLFSQREVTHVKGEILDSFIDGLVSYNYLGKREVECELEHKVDIDAVINSLHDIKSIEDLLLDKANSSNCLTNDEKSRALLLITAFPALRELKHPNEMLRFLLELSIELGNLPEQICMACEGQPQALLLIGSLLSCKPRVYDVWNRVKDDLVEIIKESNNGAFDNHMWHIYTYCYDDLSYSLTTCFLYLACYPINYEIPARSLAEILIAEEFVEPKEGETIEETANEYIEQLVQRSLVSVSERSTSGAIKCCRVHQSIHEFCIKKSYEKKFLVANPTKKEIKSATRVAFYYDDKKQYKEGRFYDVSSLLCFDFDMNVLGENLFERYMDVLELRNSVIPQKIWYGITSQINLKYLGLRGSNIYELPENIGNMKNLKTFDVRDTNIETLPESLWTIKTLRHVYVKPSPQIEGPPSTANIDNLQILKTVVFHASWIDYFPTFLMKLRKLAILYRDNPNWETSQDYGKSYPIWRRVSKLLSRMVNLHSMVFIGDIVPSEFVDLRAYPNLETVRSIKLMGQWNHSKKLIIDYIKFPPNLVKLTLTKSGLKRDPMPRLEKLQALKFLSLQDEAYTGKKMVCSENGFPQLRFLELSKLKNLEIWKVEPMAMSELTTLRVVQCDKLKGLPNLEHVIDKVIEN